MKKVLAVLVILSLMVIAHVTPTVAMVYSFTNNSDYRTTFKAWIAEFPNGSTTNQWGPLAAHSAIPSFQVDGWLFTAVSVTLDQNFWSTGKNCTVTGLPHFNTGDQGGSTYDVTFDGAALVVEFNKGRPEYQLKSCTIQ